MVIASYDVFVKKPFVILNGVKDLIADFTGRRSMANNRSFTPFRMTNLLKRHFPFKSVFHQIYKTSIHKIKTV